MASGVRVFASCISSRSLFIDHPVSLRVILNLRPPRLHHFRSAHLVTGDQPLGRMFDVTFWWSPCELEKSSNISAGFFLIERDTDPTRLSPDNVTMVIAVLCVDNQVE